MKTFIVEREGKGDSLVPLESRLTRLSVTGMRMAVATLDSLGTRRDAENRTGFSRVSSSFLRLASLSPITVGRTCGRSSFKWQSDERRSPGWRGREAKHVGSHNLEFHQALCSVTALTFRVARFPAFLDCIA